LSNDNHLLELLKLFAGNGKEHHVRNRRESQLLGFSRETAEYRSQLANCSDGLGEMLTARFNPPCHDVDQTDRDDHNEAQSCFKLVGELVERTNFSRLLACSRNANAFA
jgi:hypothetical protein